MKKYYLVWVLFSKDIEIVVYASKEPFFNPTIAINRLSDEDITICDYKEISFQHYEYLLDYQKRISNAEKRIAEIEDGEMTDKTIKELEKLSSELTDLYYGK